LLGGISIITSVLLGEYLAGSIIVLMLAGGEALESYALRSASSVLAALAKRMPSVAHRKRNAEIVDVGLQEVAVGDTLVIYPHDICPVDGVVIDGHGVMDESYLTGEPFQITKTRGSTVLSGAINGESALTIRTTQRAADSRYAKIMNVMRESESSRPTLRRLGDRLGAIYTPVALTVAVVAWAMTETAFASSRSWSSRRPARSSSPSRSRSLAPFPCAPGGRSSSRVPSCSSRSPSVARRSSTRPGRSPTASPPLTEQLIAPGFSQPEVLTLVASLERYSKHPLARAILASRRRPGCRFRKPPR
jgi:cation transport ATPase